MVFKDIKQNYPVFILNRETMALTTGKAVQVPFPRVNMNPKTGKTEMVVDLTIEVDGKTATYVIPENLSVAYAEPLILATDKSGLTGEIEAMRSTAEQILSSVDRQKDIMEKAAGLLAELNPALKERQETEKRLSSVESSMKELKNMLQDFISKMS